MSPLCVSIMLHYHCDRTHSFDPRSPAAVECIETLLSAGMLDRIGRTDDLYLDVEPTEKGEFWVRAVCELPFPRMRDPRWEIPPT